MGRPLKIDDNKKIQIVDEYFFGKAHAIASELTAKKLADYAQNNMGLNLQYYDFTRSSAVKAHIDALKSGRLQSNGASALEPYNPLDMSKFISESSASPTLLVQKLKELDDRCSCYFNNGLRLQADVIRMQTQIDALKQENELLQSQLTVAVAEAKREANTRNMKLIANLQEDLRACSRFIRHYIHPAIAKLLAPNKDSGDEASTALIDCDKLRSLIQGEKPESLSSILSGLLESSETEEPRDVVSSLLELSNEVANGETK